MVETDVTGMGEQPAPPLSEKKYENIEIQYFEEPKRKYEIRSRVEADAPGGIEGWTDWIEVPSVTTALECLEKGGLTWWGMQVGAEGAVALMNMGVLYLRQINNQIVVCTKGERMEDVVVGKDEVTALLKKHGLTTNDYKDAGGERGQGCHDAFELFMKNGTMPDPEMHPPEEQNYIRGLIMFLEHAQPEPISSEVMVGSAEHGFAGRYDGRFRITEPRVVAHHHTPVKGFQWAELAPGEYIGDVKTAKKVYYSFAKQLEAYELGSIECGYEPTEGRGVIHITDDGRYRFVRSWATGHDFLTTLAEYNSQQAMKTRKPPGGAS